MFQVELVKVMSKEVSTSKLGIRIIVAGAIGIGLLFALALILDGPVSSRILSLIALIFTVVIGFFIIKYFVSFFR